MSSYEGIRRYSVFGARIRRQAHRGPFRNRHSQSNTTGAPPPPPLKYGEYMFPGRRTWVEADQYRPPLHELKKEIKMTEHYRKLSDLLDELQTDPVKGLSSDVAAVFLERDGPNILTSVHKTTECMKFSGHLISGLALLLWAGAALCFVSGVVDLFMGRPLVTLATVYQGCVLIVIIFLSALFSYYHEAKSTQIMASFGEFMSTYARVIRDGQKQKIPMENLVRGDIVIVKCGDRIPADIRIIESSGMKVDNSNITGQSDPQTRKAACTDKDPLETENLAFFSTHCIEGSGRGVVLTTGHETVMGHISKLVSALQITETPISKELTRFVRILSVISGIMGIGAMIICLSMEYDWLECIVVVICLVVANVPEGLLVALTVCLALGAERMAHKNCLVKNLEAVETLGAASTICSDKTGTLTQNRMTVAHVWYNCQTIDVSDDPNKGSIAPEDEQGLQAWRALSRCARLCSRAEFVSKEDEGPISQRKCFGDASETAILKFMEQTVGDVMAYRNLYPKVFEIPFNSTDKFHVTVHRQGSSSSPSPFLLCMKGAPERLLSRCTTILMNGQEVDIDEDLKQTIRAAYHEMGHKGERIIGFCDHTLPEDDYGPDYEFREHPASIPLTGLRFLGLMSMVDPPRPGVREAVQKCREAGIRIILITGDHPTTAEAVAKEVGIITEKPTSCTVKDSCQTGTKDESLQHAVVLGEDLLKMKSEELDDVLRKHDEIIFARTSPQQKLRIVEGCQRTGHIVAVTGDGVNDSPALRKADIGIAMGVAGSDVSKDVADIILLDNNFSSIVTGVEEGRLIFENIKKCITYTLTKAMPEVLPFLVHIVADIPLPFSPMMILFVNLVTDLFPAVSLGYERPETDIMKKMPRSMKKEKLVDSRLLQKAYLRIGIVEAFGAFYAFFVVMAEHGFFPSRLLSLRSQWDNRSVNDLEDSVGQEWTFKERQRLENEGQSAYFVAVAILQVANLLSCKTRINSVFQQGMKNKVMNFSILLVILVSCILLYTPRLNEILRFSPIRWKWWFLGVPFAIFIFVFDETRRYLLRRFSRTSWIWQDLYW